MIKFLDVNSFCKKLKPVTSSEFFTKTGEFHPEGLFSEVLFGTLGSIERRQAFSYIDLKSKVIHPSALKIIIQLDRKIEKFLSTEELFSIDKNGNLEIDNDGVTGINEFIKMFPNIKFRGETENRDKYIELIKKAYKDNLLFIDKLPIIPPDFRPAFKDEDDNWTIDPLNEYYTTVLRRSFQVRSSSGSGALFDLLNYSLQSAVISHDDFIRTRISKKPGIIRKDLLSKRVDFSGRAVITPGPDLEVDQVGIPFRLAASIFEPFIIHRLLYSGKIDKKELSEKVKSFTGLELSVDSIQKVLKSVKSGDDIPNDLFDLLFKETEIAIEGRAVLCKRDPALHAESVRGYYPKLIRGNTIQLCTLMVTGHSADFDGDQIAVYHPLTDEAQEEAKLKMIRAESGNSSKSITFELSKEMYAGLYMISKPISMKKSPVSINDEYLEKMTDPFIPVLYRKTNTSSGRALINSCFPEGYPFVNEQFDKRLIKKLIDGMFKKYDDKIIKETAAKLERAGFKFATIMAPTFSLDDVKIPDEIYQLKDKLKGANTETAAGLLKQMEKIMINNLKGSGLYDLIESGAGKGWSQPLQILVSKGIIANPKGEILEPIKGSFSDGLTNEEFFNASAGARKGIMDRVLNTATTGYMSRKLVFVLNSVEADPFVKDCKTNKTLTLKLTNDLISRLQGRFIVKSGKLIEFEQSEYKEGDVIHLRSPIYCRSPKICHVCYGRLLLRHKSPYIGVLAAQIIGERGTQLILKSFHTGGAVEVKKRDMIKEVLDNNPLITNSSISKYISQSENTLVCNENCIINIDLNEYDIGNNLIINEESVEVESLICNAEFEDFTFSLILDYPVILPIQNIEVIEHEEIKLKYTKNSIFLETSLDTQQIKEQVNYVERLLGGREIFKDVDHLFNKLFKVYGGSVSDMDLVHLEVLLSQCLRDKKDPSKPARLGATWNPIMMNIKTAIFSTSFMQGLSFENINEAIKSGLIATTKSDPSIIEKVLTGTLKEEEI